MAKISVFKEQGGVKLGEGTGDFDKEAKTVAVTAWKDKPGLRVGTTYALEIDRASYSSANCTAVNPQSPFATFDNVV